MKRLVVVLSSLLVLPAFAEVAPSYYDDETVFTDVELGDVDTGTVEEEKDAEGTQNTRAVKAQTSVSGRNLGTAGRIASTRTSTTRNTRSTPTRSNAVRSRSISVRNAANTPVRTTSVTTRKAEGTTARTGVTARAATLGNTSGSLYNANSQSSARASVLSRSSMRAASGISPVKTAQTTPVTTTETAIDTTTEMNTMKTLTEYCQAQYASCMDNYCNVLDDNQGRCTCSKNIANYEKTEAALASATEALQDVARSIQYIGLPADQITTLFTETEAELTMKDTKDNSAIRSSLDKVKRMIVDVKSGTASASESTAMNFDLSGLLNFDMDNTGFDLSSFMGTTSNTNSISNQRGESLYKTAVSRCKASVLNSCTAQGVDAAVVTNSYDLEIDKSCLAYERALTESNKQMTQTVANAKEVLKKARLMVAQSKNSYDLRGCVSALESCMQDDYVCGNDYSNCMDPTGQYIVNGAVVVGSMPGNNTESSSATISSTYSHNNLFSTWNVGSGNSITNPWSTKKATGSAACSGSETEPCAMTLVEYINDTVTSNAAQNASDKMSAYLQNKIGYHDSKANKDYGMCMSVLNKCQDYTYDSKGKYEPQNEVIKQFLQRALVQIKMAQDELLASYAENCISDVSSCLTSNNYDSSNPEGQKSRTAINSCYSQIKTCLSVNGNVFGSVSSSAIKDWVSGNYSNIEVYDKFSVMSSVCTNITDRDECNSTKAYCSKSNGTVTYINQLCSWSGSACSIQSGHQGTNDTCQ